MQVTETERRHLERVFTMIGAMVMPIGGDGLETTRLRIARLIREELTSDISWLLKEGRKEGLDAGNGILRGQNGLFRLQLSGWRRKGARGADEVAEAQRGASREPAIGGFFRYQPKYFTVFLLPVIFF